MKITTIGIDVDGTLTDGGVYVDKDGNETVKFNRRDGHGIAMAKATGIEVFLISGENNKSTEQRAQKLGIDYYSDIKDKYKFLCGEGIKWEEFAYIGDDINDLDVLNKAAYSGCPADAVSMTILNEVDVSCVAKGGHGAVREFIDSAMLKIDLYCRVLKVKEQPSCGKCKECLAELGPKEQE